MWHIYLTMWACESFWPIIFIHVWMNPIISFMLARSFLNIWWTLGPFVSRTASIISRKIRGNCGLTSTRIFQQQWSRTHNSIRLRLAPGLFYPPPSLKAPDVCKLPQASGCPCHQLSLQGCRSFHHYDCKPQLAGDQGSTFARWKARGSSIFGVKRDALIKDIKDGILNALE